MIMVFIFLQNIRDWVISISFSDFAARKSVSSAIWVS